MDIDYMDGYKIFTVGKDRFPGLGAWAKSLREDGIKFVLIIVSNRRNRLHQVAAELR